MDPIPEEIDVVIGRYEGLIFRHAIRIEHIVEIELDDIRAIYRIKTWYALERYDSGRGGGLACARTNGGCRCARCRFVFMCLKNMEKDLLKRVRRREILLEDAAPSSQPQSRDRFEQQHGLAISHDEVYGEVEDDLLLPSTLTRGERATVLALIDGATQADIRREAGLSRGEMDRVMMSIRSKMADWKPSTSSVVQRALVAA